MKKNPGGVIILNMITINENHMMYDSWDMEHDKYFFLILDHFLPFYTPVPPNNPENQNFEKMKKATGDVIILHKCTINNNHMIYGSYEMWSAPGRFFLSSWAIFCPFTPLTAWKLNISKKWKEVLEISPFYSSIPKIMIVGYTVPEIWHVTDVIIIFHLDIFFPLLPLP